MRTGTRTEDFDSKCDHKELVSLGEVLDTSLPKLDGRITGRFLAENLLRIRDRSGKMVPFKANRAQLEFERRRGNANIILKSRQMGISTWIAGRFFLKTITRPGTLTLQVAHTQEAAEGIFRIVHRFLDELPESIRSGVLRTSKASSSQIVFPVLDSEYRVETAGDANAGRGLTIHNFIALKWRGGRAARRRHCRDCVQRCRRWENWCWNRLRTEPKGASGRSGTMRINPAWYGISFRGGWRMRIGRSRCQTSRCKLTNEV